MSLAESRYIQSGGVPPLSIASTDQRATVAVLYSHKNIRSTQQVLSWLGQDYDIAWDQDFPSHQPWHLSSEAAINASDAAIALWSVEAACSKNFIKEVSYALKKQKLVMASLAGFSVDLLPLYFTDLPTTPISERGRIRALVSDICQGGTDLG